MKSFLAGFIIGGLICTVIVYFINYKALLSEEKRMNNLLNENVVIIYRFGYDYATEGMPREEGEEKIKERMRAIQ